MDFALEIPQNLDPELEAIQLGAAQVIPNRMAQEANLATGFGPASRIENHNTNEFWIEFEALAPNDLMPNFNDISLFFRTVSQAVYQGIVNFMGWADRGIPAGFPLQVQVDLGIAMIDPAGGGGQGIAYVSSPLQGPLYRVTSRRSRGVVINHQMAPHRADFQATTAAITRQLFAEFQREWYGTFQGSAPQTIQRMRFLFFKGAPGAPHQNVRHFQRMSRLMHIISWWQPATIVESWAGYPALDIPTNQQGYCLHDAIKSAFVKCGNVKEHEEALQLINRPRFEQLKEMIEALEKFETAANVWVDLYQPAKFPSRYRPLIQLLQRSVYQPRRHRQVIPILLQEVGTPAFGHCARIVMDKMLTLGPHPLKNCRVCGQFYPPDQEHVCCMQAMSVRKGLCQWCHQSKEMRLCPCFSHESGCIAFQEQTRRILDFYKTPVPFFELPVKTSKPQSDQVDEIAEKEHRLVVYADFETTQGKPMQAFMAGMLTLLQDTKEVVDMNIIEWEETDKKHGVALRTLKHITELCRTHNISKVNIFFHNGGGFDFHYIIAAAKIWMRTYPLTIENIIAKSCERLQSFTIVVNKEIKLRFLDSLNFLLGGLGNLVTVALKGRCSKEAFPLFWEHFKSVGYTRDFIEAILRKNSFPYRYQKSFHRQTKSCTQPMEKVLAHKKQFVYPTPIPSKKFIAHCNKMGLVTMNDYCKMYLYCDVLQLADLCIASEAFFKENYNIEMNKQTGLPSLAWGVICQRLRENWVSSAPKPLVITDHRQAMVCRACMRGGITCCSKRQALSTSTRSIIYIDANGLQPAMMHKPMPCGDFTFQDESSDTCKQVMRSPQLYLHMLQEARRGCFICVDMQQPSDVARSTSEQPLMPYRGEVQFDTMSSFTKELTKTMGDKKITFKGLLADVLDKENQVVSSPMLEFQLEMGLQIKKVHQVMEFDMFPYLHEPIAQNERLRNEQNSEQGRTMVKLLSNQVFGKTCENMAARLDAFSYNMNDDESFNRLQEEFAQRHIKRFFYREMPLIFAELHNRKILIDKPMYIGPMITEYAKLHMYKMWFQVIKKVFPLAELLQTDTDQFILSFEHPEDITAPVEYFATRVNSLDSSIEPECRMDTRGLDLEPQHAMEPGYFKQETGKDVIEEFCGLRAKCQAQRCKGGGSGVRAKGTSKENQQALALEDYKKIVFSHSKQDAMKCGKQTRIGSKMHCVEVITSERRLLTGNDGKRFICENGIDTLPYGYPDEAEESLQNVIMEGAPFLKASDVPPPSKRTKHK